MTMTTLTDARTVVLPEPVVDNDGLTVVGLHTYQGRNAVVTLAMGSLDCAACGLHVDVTTEGHYVSRINGDSRYGYEPTHDECPVNADHRKCRFDGCQARFNPELAAEGPDAHGATFTGWYWPLDHTESPALPCHEHTN